MLPAAFSGSPSYTLLSVGVVTVSVAGETVIVPSTFLTFSLAVTSSPFAFLMISVSHVAFTASAVTSVTLAFDSAFSNL